MNSLIDLFGFLAFVGTALLILAVLVRMIYLTIRARWDSLRSTFKFLALYLAGYFILLVAFGLLLPRQTLPAGTPECFDDWCAAALEATPATLDQPCPKTENETIWVTTLKVSSVAKRIRQRALDAQALLEDQMGQVYMPCTAPLQTVASVPHALSDPLGPGESFEIQLAFRLPSATQPAGMIISHGAFPGILIIGADQSFLHRRTLLQMTIVPGE